MAFDPLSLGPAYMEVFVCGCEHELHVSHTQTFTDTSALDCTFFEADAAVFSVIFPFSAA